MKQPAAMKGTTTPLWLLVFAITALRIFYLSLNQFDLFFDEAQYWGWSQDMAWGYYSKPPVIALLIRMTTTVCGDGEACVRLASPLMHAIVAIAIYFTAISLFKDRKIAFYSSLAYLTLPAVSISSALISTDPPLLTFWALCTLFFAKALKTKRLRWWLLAGVAAGFGMMSKYNMLMFFISAIAYLATSSTEHKLLASPRFWLAAVLALVIFLPNMFWNFQHGMVSFLHTKDNAEGNGLSLYPLQLLEFFGAQFGVFGPIFFGALLVILSQYKTTLRKDENRMLAWFILPLLLVILIVSLLSRAHANWAAPIYVPATILVVAWLINHHKMRWLKASIGLHIAVALIFVCAPLIDKLPKLELVGGKTDLKEGKIKDPFQRVQGWRDLGEGASVLMGAYPQATLMTDARKIHAELLYYAKPHPFNAIKWNPAGNIGDHYDLTTDIKNAGTQDFILITERSDVSDMAEYFDYIDRIGNIEVSAHKDKPRDFYAYYLGGFKGYDKQK